MVLLTIFLTTFAFGQFETTLSLLNKYLGLNRHENYAVFAYIGFILLLSQGLLVRPLIPRLGERAMAIAGTILMTAGLVLIGMAAIDHSSMMLYSVVPIAVVGFSAVTPSLQSLLSRHTAATQQGGMLGLGQSISALARILGPWVGMNLHGLNILWPYWAGAALMAICVLLAVGLRRPGDLPQDAASM
jgi:MFS family permease